MTNEIIIDSVDVSGCMHYKNDSCVADYLTTDMPFSEAKCKNSPDCYYKQLQREKQKSEALTQSEQETNEIIAELKQENKKLRHWRFVWKDYASRKYSNYKQNLKDIIFLEKRTLDLIKKNEELEKINKNLEEKLFQIENIIKPINEQLPEDNVCREIMLILNTEYRTCDNCLHMDINREGEFTCSLSDEILQRNMANGCPDYEYWEEK